MTEPRQKFYTKPFKKGCSIVAFYSFLGREFSEQEVAQMVACATEYFAELPWQASPSRDVPYQLFVWVDITEDILSIGVALTGDQARVGHNKWRKADWKDNDVTSPDFVCSCLKQYAKGWLERENNISDAKEADRKFLAFYRKKKSRKKRK